MKEVLKGASEGKMANRYGLDVYNEAMKRLAVERGTHMTLQQLYAKQEAERRAYFRERTSQGVKSQRASQQDHNAIVDSILRSINDGIKPDVLALLRAYGDANDRDLVWVKRIASQTHNKKMGKTLQLHKSHPVIQELKDARMFTQTHKGAIQRSTYSGLAELLFSGSQNVRKQRHMEREIEELREMIARLKADVAKMHARVDDSEYWKVKTKEMHVEGMSCGKIAERLGKAKSTINDYIRTLVKAGILLPRTRQVLTKGYYP